MDIVAITGAVATILTLVGGGLGWLITRIETRINRLEEHHAACTKENAELREEIGTLRAEAAQANKLRDEVAALRAELDQVKRELKIERDRPR